jgi:hypothetical protein
MITPSRRLPRFPRASAFLPLSMLLAALNAQAQPVPRPVQPDPLVRMNESKAPQAAPASSWGGNSPPARVS